MITISGISPPTAHPQNGQLRQSVRTGHEHALRSGGGGSTCSRIVAAARAATPTTAPRTGRITKRCWLVTQAPPGPRAILFLGGPLLTLSRQHSVPQGR